MFTEKLKALVTRVVLTFVLVVGVFGVIPAHASSTILYVDKNATGANDGTSWADAYTDLQSALSAASSGDEIWVAAGTYKPTSGTDRTASFVLKSGVELYGNFSGTETSLAQRANCLCPVKLSGDIGVVDDNSDNSYHVVVASNTDSSTLLDDITITDGNANGSISSEYYFGGGMYNDNGNPQLNDVTFTDNYAGVGGGMYTLYTIEDYNTVDLVLTDVTFSNNTAAGEGGGMAAYFLPQPSSASFHLNLTDVIFKNNTAMNGTGGGMINSVGVLTMVDVTFSDNTALGGGGLSNLPNGGDPSTLTNVIFSNNSAEQGGGGMLVGSDIPSTTTLTNVTFNNNSTAGSGGGITNLSDSELILVNVTFSDNTATMNGGGLSNGGIPGLEDGGTINLINTTLTGNTAGSNGGAIYNESGNVNINNSILYGNSGEEIYGTANVTYSIVQDGYTGTGNLDADPLLGPLQDNGGPILTMALGSGSPAIDSGDDSVCPNTDQRGIPRPQDDHCDMGAYEYRHEILHVKWDATGANDGTSWADAYTDLQSALAASLYGDEIWVAAGTYYPTPGMDRTVSFELQNGAKMYGGFSGEEISLDQRDFETNATILSGDIGVVGDNSDNSYHVVFAGKLSDTHLYSGNVTVINDFTVLDGFTITAGNANGELEHDDGGGMLNLQSHPTISNVIFTGNSAVSRGGGMNSVVSHPTFTNVVFNDNLAADGGGIVITQGILINVVISENLATNSGGGLVIVQGNPTLTNVTINGNSAGSRGGGISNSQSNPTLTNVTISGNSAGSYGGGISNTQGNPILTNVTISGNSASSDGGGISNTQGNPTLTNVTISGNSAGSDGGGIYNVISNPIIRNIILWGNTAPTGSQMYNHIFNTSPVVSYSIVQGGYEGENNIDYNPLLGPLQDNGGFTQTMALGNGSPAIDNGDISNCPATDQRGVPRPQNGSCDIGAYEFELSIPVELTVTADDYTITYGDADPTFTFTYSGFQSGDDETDIETPPTCSVSGIHSNAGTYSISCAGAVDSDGVYAFEYVDGDLTINKATPTLSVTNSPVAYNGSAQSANVIGSVEGIVNNIRYDGSANAPVNAGTYAVTADFTPDDTANYNPLTNASAGDFIIGSPLTTTLKSIATQDGWVLETSETSGQGGTLNNTGTVLYVGDNAQDKQYRSILSFNTMGLPDDAVITSVKLKIRVQGFVGDNPFTPVKTHGNLLMDINGLYFGANANLAVNDFQSAVGLNGLNAAGVLTSAPMTGWYTVNLKSAAYDFVNLMGKTQFRLRFQTDDNDDNGADYLKIFSGNAPTANRPQLIVQYYVP